MHANIIRTHANPSEHDHLFWSFSIIVERNGERQALTFGRQQAARFNVEDLHLTGPEIFDKYGDKIWDLVYWRGAILPNYAVESVFGPDALKVEASA